MSSDPAKDIIVICRTLSNSHSQIINLFISGFNLYSIQFQKRQHDIYADPLVSINKSMV